MMKFNIELVKEVPDAIGSSTGKSYPVRLYKSREEYPRKEIRWRWHLGFPEKIVKPLCPLLETSPYWDAQHHQEVDGFWVWWIMALTKTDDPPWKEINDSFRFHLTSYKQCFRLLSRGARQGKEKA